VVKISFNSNKTCLRSTSVTLIGLIVGLMFANTRMNVAISLTKVSKLRSVIDAGAVNSYCQHLERQFNVAGPSHQSYRSAAAARELRLSRGADLLTGPLLRGAACPQASAHDEWHETSQLRQSKQCQLYRSVRGRALILQ